MSKATVGIRTRQSAQRGCKIAQDLLRWFVVSAREMPWRRTRDPYAIWVSEVMLQQTQVKTVIPFWKRWMRELPDLQALANAPAERVLKLWEGLGYYSRARNLQRAAQEIVRENGGRLPADFEQLLKLPGVGRYTAGAICSLAFNQPTPVLDGNVTRVVTRLWGIRGDPKSGRVCERLWRLASVMVNAAAEFPEMAGASRETFGASRPGNCSLLNQGLMELGAIICTPVNPRCELCPARPHCTAHRLGRPEQFPTQTRRIKTQQRKTSALIAERAGKILVRQRPAGVVNGGFWELPNIEGEDVVSLSRGIPESDLEQLQRVGTIRHTIMHYRIELTGYAIQVAGNGQSRCLGKVARWVTDRELDRLPFVSAHRKLLRLWRSGNHR